MSALGEIYHNLLRISEGDVTVLKRVTDDFAKSPSAPTGGKTEAEVDNRQNNSSD